MSCSDYGRSLRMTHSSIAGRGLALCKWGGSGNSIKKTKKKKTSTISKKKQCSSAGKNLRVNKSTRAGKQLNKCKVKKPSVKTRALALLKRMSRK